MTMTEISPDKLRGINVQFKESDLARLENWRRQQPKIPPLATTIRALVFLGLKAASADTKRPSSKDTAA